jgi:hypothetical protein
MKRHPEGIFPHPTHPRLGLDHGSFEVLQEYIKGKLRTFRRCRFVPITGPYAGKRCEFSARNDSHYFSVEEQGQHEHKWTIIAFHERPTVAFIPCDLAPHFAQFVCDTNMFFRQAKQPDTSEFCNTLIRYGFSLGMSAPLKQLSTTELFPELVMPELRHERGENTKGLSAQQRCWLPTQQRCWLGSQQCICTLFESTVF